MDPISLPTDQRIEVFRTQGPIFPLKTCSRPHSRLCPLPGGHNPSLSIPDSPQVQPPGSPLLRPFPGQAAPGNSPLLPEACREGTEVPSSLCVLYKYMHK